MYYTVLYIIIFWIAKDGFNMTASPVRRELPNLASDD